MLVRVALGLLTLPLACPPQALLTVTTMLALPHALSAQAEASSAQTKTVERGGRRKDEAPPPAVPEPTVFGIVGAGLLAYSILRRKRGGDEDAEKTDPSEGGES